VVSIERFRQFLGNANVAAFLRVIRACEGTADEDGYRRMFGGALFNSWADHPRKAQTFRLKKGGTLTSTAAGAYQFLSRTWDGLVRRYGFEDFSPANQDLGAVALLDGRGALMDLVRGDLDAAVKKCAREWASLPGSPYGQPVKTLAFVHKVYADHGGQLGPAGPKEAPVAPFIAAALPALIEAVPALIRSFGKGEVTERNAKAAEVVLGVAKEAIGAKNEQELVEKLEAEPDAKRIVAEAVEREWFRIEEAGGGGIAGARAADMAMVTKDGPWWQVVRSPSFLVACALLPLVYMVTGAVVGLFGQPFSEDVRAAIANGVIGMILGGLIGYYYGQTTSRNRASAGSAES
jgi:muramidase (phage lysozyme)